MEKQQRMTVGRVVETIGGLGVQIHGSVPTALTPVRVRSDHPLEPGDTVWCVEMSPGIWVSMGPVFTTVDYFPEVVVGENRTIPIRFTEAGLTIDGNVIDPEAPPAPPAVNQPQGNIQITGEVRVGETVSIGVVQSFLDRLGNAAFPDYQWLLGGSPITGATASTLFLLEAWEGQTLSATASFTDEPLPGAAEGILYSTSAIGGEILPVIGPEEMPESVAVITAVTTTTVTVQMTSENVPPGSTAEISLVGAGYNNSSAVPATGGIVTFTGVPPSTFVTATPTITTPVGASFPGTPDTDRTLAIENRPASGGPRIQGTPREGSTVRGFRGSVSDPDGIDANTVLYTWTLGFDTPAAGQSFDIPVGRAGENLSLTYSFTDDLGFDEARSRTVVVLPDLEAVCLAAGGMWDAATSSCELPNPNRDACIANGGTWDNDTSTCTLPPPPTVTASIGERTETTITVTVEAENVPPGSTITVRVTGDDGYDRTNTVPITGGDTTFPGISPDTEVTVTVTVTLPDGTTITGTGDTGSTIAEEEDCLLYTSPSPRDS